MSKISVVYWSQTGNTQAMAEAVGAGITKAGKEADVVEVSGASMEDLRAAKVFASHREKPSHFLVPMAGATVSG